MSFHLTKLLNKYYEYIFRPTIRGKSVVQVEVVPDLLIYSQEIMIKFDFEFWPTPVGDLPVDACLRQLLEAAATESMISEAEILSSLLSAASALGDICDKSDHNRVSRYSIKDDVAVPLVLAARDLTITFDLDIDTLYFTRLEDMREKYLTWSL